ncbi:hypothetical protein [Planctomicrobium piriforme]|uniref:ABC transporter permease n=1 Tax=Planctomicrobium piriforme TaxID=1576369 RepID=A0A1I3IDG1_9PLAN|nr:hypothetical protein [Planctomicrobium piriforme]SFI45991.1 hypothetical protein SAMN05421753_10975 [Planctomicrobium piriforme]
MTTLASVPEQASGEFVVRSTLSPRRRRWLWLEAFIERFFIAFCVYALSIGPMYWHWVAGREVKGSLWIATFYEPLRILGEMVPLFGEWLNWYVRLWIG